MITQRSVRLIRYQSIENPYRLENGLREALLKAGEEKALVVLEGLYRLQYAGDTWMTFNQIFHLLNTTFGMSYQLVYQGLQAKLIYQRRKAEARAHRKGARPYLYRLPYPQELTAEYAPELPHTPSDTLEKSDLKTVHAYRLGLHRELGIRLWLESGGKGYEMYREPMAERLGVSVRTARTYDQILGFSNSPNVDKREITQENWQTLPRYKNKYDDNGKRLPSRKWLEVEDWRTGEIEIFPHVRYLAYVALLEGKQVYEVERRANTYYPYERPDPRDYEGGEYSFEFYLAHTKARNEAGFFQDSNDKWYYQRE